jgi:hypothetical protein
MNTRAAGIRLTYLKQLASFHLQLIILLVTLFSFLNKSSVTQQYNNNSSKLILYQYNPELLVCLFKSSQQFLQPADPSIKEILINKLASHFTTSILLWQLAVTLLEFGRFFLTLLLAIRITSIL